MKCANCEMVNQIPETPCSHCGRMMPALKPSYISEDGDDAAEKEKETQPQTESGQAEGAENTQAPPDAGADAGGESGDAGGETVAVEGEAEGGAEQVTPESGHVDNVGDESETETVVP